MIKAENLTKKFKQKKGREVKLFAAVNHVDLEIKKGEIFGLIGPNGAGKTTLIKILSTLILPDEGRVLIDGQDIRENNRIVKSKIGILVGEYTRALYWRLSGYKNLKFFATLQNMQGKEREKKIDELLDLLKLKEMKNEMVMKYSTGTKHKLALAIALLKDPPILFLDEPLTSVDLLTSYEIKKFIKENLNHKAIIWASHNLYEIEEICDRVGVLIEGKIIFQNSPEELKCKYWKDKKISIFLDSRNAQLFTNINGASIKDDYTIEIKTTDMSETLLDIETILKNNELKIKEIKSSKPTLEDIFIRIKKEKEEECL